MTSQERIEAYSKERKDAVERIEKLFQSRGITTLPLSDVVEFLPKNPEWDIYRKKIRRKAASR
jgi:hypothetical protein